MKILQLIHIDIILSLEIVNPLIKVFKEITYNNYSLCHQHSSTDHPESEKVQYEHFLQKKNEEHILILTSNSQKDTEVYRILSKNTE